jgi:hypothetical protein
MSTDNLTLYLYSKTLEYPLDPLRSGSRFCNPRPREGTARLSTGAGEYRWPARQGTPCHTSCLADGPACRAGPKNTANLAVWAGPGPWPRGGEPPPRRRGAVEATWGPVPCRRREREGRREELSAWPRGGAPPPVTAEWSIELRPGVRDERKAGNASPAGPASPSPSPSPARWDPPASKWIDPCTEEEEERGNDEWMSLLYRLRISYMYLLDMAPLTMWETCLISSITLYHHALCFKISTFLHFMIWSSHTLLHMMISLYILEGIIEKVFATVDLNDSSR